MWGENNLSSFQGTGGFTNDSKTQSSSCKCHWSESNKIWIILFRGLWEVEAQTKSTLQSNSSSSVSIPVWGGLPPPPLYFFSFLRLPGWLVRLLLWNVLWDKRSGDPETQWPPGEASLSSLFCPPFACILSPLSLSFSLPPSLTHSFSLVSTLMPAQVLWLGLFLHSLSLNTHTNTKAWLYS